MGEAGSKGLHLAAWDEECNELQAVRRYCGLSRTAPFEHEERTPAGVEPNAPLVASRPREREQTLVEGGEGNEMVGPKGEVMEQGSKT